MSIVPEIEAMPENLLRAPLDFLFADHFRQMLVCNLLDLLAGEVAPEQAPRIAERALEYLTRELPLHIADEEADLFPQLKEHLPQEASLARMLVLLSDEHREDLRLATALRQGLEAHVQGKPPAPAFAPAVASFTATQRRHISWENGVLLPEARNRLPAAALEAIGRGMAARRGIEYPGV